MIARKRLLFTACFLGVLWGVVPLRPVNAQTAIEKLRADFAHPPTGAKPMMRWWWFGLAVEKPEIRRELEQMKADGIGGVELAFVYPQVVDDPAKGLVNEPFLGGPMLDNVSYAASEGRRLGLRVDVTLGSGWPYGGPATTLTEAADAFGWRRLQSRRGRRAWRQSRWRRASLSFPSHWWPENRSIGMPLRTNC